MKILRKNNFTLKIFVLMFFLLILGGLTYYFSTNKTTNKVIVDYFSNRIEDYDDMKIFLQNSDIFNVEKIVDNFSKNIVTTGDNYNIQKLEGYPTYFAEIPFSEWKGNIIKISFLNANVGMHIYYHNPLLSKDFEYQPFSIFGQYPGSTLGTRLRNPCFFLTYQIGLNEQLSKLDKNCHIINVSNTELYPNLLIERTFWNMDITPEDVILNITFLNII